MLIFAACLLLRASTPAPPACTPHPAQNPAAELHQVVPAARTNHAWRL